MGVLHNPSRALIIHNLYNIVKEYNRKDNMLPNGQQKVTSAQKISALKLIAEMQNYISVKEKRDKGVTKKGIDIELKF